MFHPLVLHLVCVGLVLFFLSFAFYYQRHGDMFFYTDIGRDMLILQDLSIKKISFIGARTSLMGVFHGPAWEYLNLPAFLLTKGDPLLMGWYWVLLSLLFLLSVYVVTRKLFDANAGLIAAVLMSINMIVLHPYFTNPIGSLFCLPLFLFCMVRYVQTGKVGYLIAHLLIGGLIVQFEMMIGGPMLLLSFILCMVQWRKTKHYAHVISSLSLLLPLSTFILFDLRHNFLQLGSLLDYATGKADPFPAHREIFILLLQRFEIATRTAMGVFPLGRFEVFNTLIVIIFASVFLQRNAKKLKQYAIYSIFGFYYIGYFLLSFVLKDTLLFHYYYPLCVLPVIVFAGLYNYLDKRVLVFIFAVILVSGYKVGVENVWDTNGVINDSGNSWKTLRTVGSIPFQGDEVDVGYFVYAPDVYAYQQKYAVSYASTLYPGKTVHPFEKRPVTYLVIARASEGKKEVSSTDWKAEKLHISSKHLPDAVYSLESGYRVEKYIFTPEEIKVPVDSDVGFNLYFR